MYYNTSAGTGYNAPGRRAIYQRRRDVIASQFGPPDGRSLSIAGCGYGYLVDELTDDGWTNCAGFDDGVWCLTRILAGELPASKKLLVVKADVLDETGPESTQTVKQQFGITGQNKIDLVISEDLLPCLSDAELTTALENMRDMATSVAHIVTVVDTDQNGQEFQPPGTYMSAADLHPGQELNWKTAAAWKELVSSDVLIRTGTYDVVA